MCIKSMLFSMKNDKQCTCGAYLGVITMFGISKTIDCRRCGKKYDINFDKPDKFDTDDGEVKE